MTFWLAPVLNLEEYQGHIGGDDMLTARTPESLSHTWQGSDGHLLIPPLRIHHWSSAISSARCALQKQPAVSEIIWVHDPKPAPRG